MLWTLLALAVVAVLAFLAIVVKFVARAAYAYARRKPVQAAAFFALPGGLATFTATFFLLLASMTFMVTSCSVGFMGSRTGACASPLILWQSLTAKSVFDANVKRAAG